jgi:hypothetical protein
MTHGAELGGIAHHMDRDDMVVGNVQGPPLSTLSPYQTTNPSMPLISPGRRTWSSVLILMNPRIAVATWRAP